MSDYIKNGEVLLCEDYLNELHEILDTSGDPVFCSDGLANVQDWLTTRKHTDHIIVTTDNIVRLLVEMCEAGLDEEASYWLAHAPALPESILDEVAAMDTWYSLRFSLSDRKHSPWAKHYYPYERPV